MPQSARGKVEIGDGFNVNDSEQRQEMTNATNGMDVDDVDGENWERLRVSVSSLTMQRGVREKREAKHKWRVGKAALG